MNKLFLMILSLSFVIIQADELSDAIRASDYEKVTKIMAERNNRAEPKAISATEREKYLEVAKQIIDLRKQQVITRSLRRRDVKNLDTNMETIVVLASVALPFLYIGAENAHIINRSVEGFLASMIVSYFALCGALVSTVLKYDDCLDNLYDNSLKNYEMVHDQGL